MDAKKMRELAKENPAKAGLIAERNFWKNYCNAMIDAYAQLYTFLEDQGFDPEKIFKEEKN